MKEQNQEGKRPEKNFKVGAVSAAVWAQTYATRNGRPFEVHRVVIERAYKDAQGEWKNTSSLDFNDIPKAMVALQRAYEYIATKAKAPEAESAPLVVVEERV
jgi:hypothetical protein